MRVKGWAEQEITNPYTTVFCIVQGCPTSPNPKQKLKKLKSHEVPKPYECNFSARYTDHVPEYTVATIRVPTRQLHFHFEGEHILHFSFDEENLAVVMIITDEATKRKQPKIIHLDVPNFQQLLLPLLSTTFQAVYQVDLDCLCIHLVLKSDRIIRESTQYLLQKDYTTYRDYNAVRMIFFDLPERITLKESQDVFWVVLHHVFDLVQHFNMSQRSVFHSIRIATKSIGTDLREYQKEAVRWLVHRERATAMLNHEELLAEMYREVDCGSNGSVFVSRYGGRIFSSRPRLYEGNRGGLLADEMGLGKTLEIICLILSNPCTDDNIGQLLLPDDRVAPPITRTEAQGETFESTGVKKFDDFSLFIPDNGFVVHDGFSIERKVTGRGAKMQTKYVYKELEKDVLCSCGGTGQKGQATVKCSRCFGPKQHRICVRYDGPENAYVCPTCWSRLVVRSRATLIISPDHIWHQWQDELKRHIRDSNLSIYVYSGMSNSFNRVNLDCEASFDEPSSPAKRSTCGFLQPSDLANADIVLTAYSVMANELNWAEASEREQNSQGARPSLRRVARYLKRPCPLTCVKWYRICLDEAQMIENSNNKTAKLMQYLRSQIRWSVTGTPVENSIDDFQGLMAYLQLEPYSYPHLWHNMIHQPTMLAVQKAPTGGLRQAISQTPLVKLLQGLLWRNTERLVHSELDLPSIEEKIHWVNFSPVERYIHDIELTKLATTLKDMLLKARVTDYMDSPLSNLPSSVNLELMHILRTLRLSCTHSSLVLKSVKERIPASRHSVLHISKIEDERNGAGDSSDNSGTTVNDRAGKRKRPKAAKNNGCLSMSEVLRRVIDETRRECEGHFRSFVLNKNGAAACHILQKNYLLAADCYRRVLAHAEDLENDYGVLSDCSQHLHAITNLHWLFSDGLVKSEGAHEDNLVERAHRLRMSYIQTRSCLLLGAHEQLSALNARFLKNLAPPTLTDDSRTWLGFLHQMLDFLEARDQLRRLPGQLTASFEHAIRADLKRALLHCSDTQSFRTLLLTEFEELLQAKKSSNKAMEPLTDSWTEFQKGTPIDETMLRQYYDCCAYLDLEESQENNQDKSRLKQKKKKRAKRTCVHCKALTTWLDYQSSFNYIQIRSDKRESILSQRVGQHEGDESDDEKLHFSGVYMHNPLITALNLVAVTYTRGLDFRSPFHETVKSFSNYFTLMAREIVLISRVQSLTKEWWNLHEETEQFVTRLQTTSPTDLAYVPASQIPQQLQQQTVTADLAWSTLQSRLGHLRFLKNSLKNRGATSMTDMECPTCWSHHSEESPTFVLLPGCWHPLCSTCHDKINSSHYASRRRCPICRYPFPSAQQTVAQEKARRRFPLTYVHFQDKKTANLIKPPKSQTAEESESDEDEQPLHVEGDHSSKIKDVLRQLMRVRAKDPLAKVLVFSSSLYVLDTIDRALCRHGIDCATLFTNREARRHGALAAFRCPGSMCWILLMSLDIGSNGLNITEANHLFFVDPVLNAAKEAQAIGRIHRIGQTRSCTIHRFLVRDSIESTLHAVHASHTSDKQQHRAHLVASSSTGSHKRSTSMGEEDEQLLQLSVRQLFDMLEKHREASSITTPFADNEAIMD